MGKRAGTYNVLNVWRLEEGCWEYCRWASDRLGGETSWMPMARRARRGVVAQK